MYAPVPASQHAAVTSHRVTAAGSWPHWPPGSAASNRLVLNGELVRLSELFRGGDLFCVLVDGLGFAGYPALLPFSSFLFWLLLSLSTSNGRDTMNPALVGAEIATKACRFFWRDCWPQASIYGFTFLMCYRSEIFTPDGMSTHVADNVRRDSDYP